MKLKEAFEIFSSLIPPEGKNYCVSVVESEKFSFNDLLNPTYYFYNKIEDLPGELLDKEVLHYFNNLNCIEVLGGSSEKNKD